MRRSQMRLDGGARGAADGVTKARHAALMEVGIAMEVCSGDDGSAADGAGRETNGPSRRKTARSIACVTYSRPGGPRKSAPKEFQKDGPRDEKPQRI